MANIQFYIIDIDYITTQSGKAVIRIFGRTFDGKKICGLDMNFEPYFYVLPGEEADMNTLISEIKECKEEDSFVKNVITEVKKDFDKNITALKVIVNHPKDVPILSKLILEIQHAREIRENDILFAKRYLIDKNITPLTLCEANGNNITREELNVDLAIVIDEIKSSLESISDINVLAFDIETYVSGSRYPDSRHDPIICVAFYGNNFQKIITYKKIHTDLDVTFVKNEHDLLLEFVKIIKNYKPDCLSGYFSDGFDFPYIMERARIYGIKLDIGMDNSTIRSNKRSSSISITGIPNVDLLKFIKTIMSGSLQLESYSLNEVSRVLLDEKKIDFKIDKIGMIWDSNNEKEINNLLEYNLKDAELVYKLFKLLSYDICELVKLIGQNLDDVTRMRFGQLVEWYLIKKTKEFDEIIPNKPGYSEKSERLMHTYQGAFVYQPEPGLYENLAVFDFKSLYPSIIIAHNIDPGTLTNEKEDSCESPDIIDESGKITRYYFSSKEEGFIPAVLKDIIIRRSRIKEMIKKEKKHDNILEARSYMLKIIANATYGMFGYSGARWYSKECAASITAFGRDYILRAIEKAKFEDYLVVYSDTDSIITILRDKTKEDALRFMNEVNDSLPEFMKLELEKFYKGGLFVMKKNELGGAKKKYALIDEDDKLKIRGFETIRRDWSYLAKETQLKVLEIILKEKSIEKAAEYAKNIIEDIRKKRIDINKMVIRTQLRKEIKHYDAIGPHVRVAEKMKQEGIMVGVGSVISYVITEGKGSIGNRAKPLENCKPDEYDAEYYINNQIIPAIKNIFEAAGYTKDILTEKKGQSKLSNFFGG